ncbi:MAG: GNAT family N-acetyltransferase [Burkholderiales bacterium]|nr:MAG: GNAT family N-acetyltransferase [Burkholderiales bacterium]
MTQTSTPFSLRPATSADWPVVARLLEGHGLPRQGAEANLSNTVLAVADGEVLGCAAAEMHGTAALLRSVAVAPGQQGRGIGRVLVSTVLDEARRRGVPTIHLLTTTAPDWFARFGFELEPIGRAPAALAASAEFQGACPASAVFMSQVLRAPRTVSAGGPADALPVAVIGAGPVGLAALARLLERGIGAIVLEAGDSVGAHLLDYGHVRLFSPWRFDIDPAIAARLEASGWRAPPDEDLPLARDVVERVLRPFAALPEVARCLRLGTRVTGIAREGFDKARSAGREAAPFVIHALQDGRPITLRARAVIDASGTWSTPNPLGASGLPALGEVEHAAAIVHGIPDVLGRDRARYAGRRTLVVGAGHSAANVLLDLAALAREAPGTRLVWATRSTSLARVFGGGDADGLPARGQLGASLAALRADGGLAFVGGLHVTAVSRAGPARGDADAAGGLVVEGTLPDGRLHRIEDIDQIVCATGQRPDLDLTRELRVALDPWLESAATLGPLIDPNLHSCGTVRPHGHRELGHPEPGLYTVGVKSYGRAPTFLMATGFEQVRSVVAAIAGDLESADRVALELPSTGVCSIADAAPAAAESCCAPAIAGPATVSCCAPAIVEPEAASCCAPAIVEPAAASCCAPAIVEPAAASCCAPKPAPVAATRCCG